MNSPSYMPFIPKAEPKPLARPEPPPAEPLAGHIVKTVRRPRGIRPRWSVWDALLDELQARPKKAKKIRPPLSDAQMRTLRSAAHWRKLGLHIQLTPRNDPKFSLVWIRGKVKGPKEKGA